MIAQKLIRFINRIDDMVHSKSKKGEWVWVGSGENPTTDMEEF